ncbi:MAG TPA: flavohemoglobin expression-modulating QEGLA motif protein [Gammaproteobacteria bacterium]|nr:flavohemoglobin expression-modulating QEGLA motif protein [Gammaproteobacteria bacterium]
MNDKPVMIGDDIIENIREVLSNNQSVRYKLPEGGRVHVDRQLPFLCLYRYPQDHEDGGTDRLLLGEAAYILASAVTEHHTQLTRLVHEILAIQSGVFGACLLLEIWAGDEVADEQDQPAFHIVAPNTNVPANVLEDMENALLGIHVNEVSAHITLSYRESISAPGCSDIISNEALGQLNCTHLGLEVSPIYREAEGQSLLPFRLRQLHHVFANALKRTFYSFAHNVTQLRLAHYHELGRQFITGVVHETDEQLTEISNSFDLLLHVTPVNAQQAWQKFQKDKYQKYPEFLYRPRNIDPDLMKRQLYQVPIEHIEDPTLAYIFSSKREELDRQITLVADRNTPRFLLGSRQLFGDIPPVLLDLAKEMLSLPPPAQKTETSYLSASEFADQARQEIEWYREQDPELPAQVELRDDVPGILVSRGHLLVGQDTQIPENRVNATLAHEVGTHIVTHYNGRQQPFRELYAGMAGYEPLQEGLAVLAEYLSNELSHMRMRLLAGRVMAVDMISNGADFIESFRLLENDYGFSQANAYTICMRVYRGGGYTKDFIYLQGLVNVLDYLAAGQQLDRLYIGKITYEHLDFIEELQWRKVLVEPRLRPRFLDDPRTASRLDRLYQGTGIVQIMMEAS